MLGCNTTPNYQAGNSRTNCVSVSSATTVLSSGTLHTYQGQFDWQNLVFMNMHEAGETSLLPMKSHVTIKYS